MGVQGSSGDRPSGRVVTVRSQGGLRASPQAGRAGAASDVPPPWTSPLPVADAPDPPPERPLRNKLKRGRSSLSAPHTAARSSPSHGRGRGITDITMPDKGSSGRSRHGLSGVRKTRYAWYRLVLAPIHPLRGRDPARPARGARGATSPELQADDRVGRALWRSSRDAASHPTGQICVNRFVDAG